MKLFENRHRHTRSDFQTEHDRLAAQGGSLRYNAPSMLAANQGPGPSGTLAIHLSQRLCPGFKPDGGTIELEYEMPSGTQL